MNNGLQEALVRACENSLEMLAKLATIEMAPSVLAHAMSHAAMLCRACTPFAMATSEARRRLTQRFSQPVEGTTLEKRLEEWVGEIRESGAATWREA